MLWLTKGVSIRLLARTAGRTWVRCCSGRTVRNRESLRGLRCTLQERRGLGKARALLGPLAVRTYRTGVKALSCPKPCGRERRLCRVQSRADERTRAKALSGQSRAVERTRAKALSGQSCAVERTRAKALSRGVMVKAMNCGIVVREFVLQSRYYVYFRANTLGKGMNPLILPPAMGK